MICFQGDEKVIIKSRHNLNEINIEMFLKYKEENCLMICHETPISASPPPPQKKKKKFSHISNFCDYASDVYIFANCNNMSQDL